MIKRFHSNLFLVKSIEQTAEFYKNLGFDISRSENTLRIKIGDFTLAFMDEARATIDQEAGQEPKGIGIFTYVEVDDVDKQYRIVRERGIVPSGEPKDWSWGKREFAVKDPDGYKIIFYSPNGES